MAQGESPRVSWTTHGVFPVRNPVPVVTAVFGQHFTKLAVGPPSNDSMARICISSMVN